MKSLSTLIAFILLGTAATAQVKTVESRTTETEVDSVADGKVRVTETVSSVEMTEDLTVRTHLVTIDPIRFFMLFNAGYQHAISPQFTVGGTVQAPTQLANAEGFGVTAEARFYPGGKPFRSFHIGGALAYNDITTTRYGWTTGAEEEVKVAPFSAGVSVGWHWYPWQDLATEFAIGADYNFSSEGRRFGEVSDPVPFLSTAKGIVPSARFTVGYAW